MVSPCDAKQVVAVYPLGAPRGGCEQSEGIAVSPKEIKRGAFFATRFSPQCILYDTLKLVVLVTPSGTLFDRKIAQPPILPQGHREVPPFALVIAKALGAHGT